MSHPLNVLPHETLAKHVDHQADEHEGGADYLKDTHGLAQEQHACTDPRDGMKSA